MRQTGDRQIRDQEPGLRSLLKCSLGLHREEPGFVVRCIYRAACSGGIPAFVSYLVRDRVSICLTGSWRARTST